MNRSMQGSAAEGGGLNGIVASMSTGKTTLERDLITV